MALQSSCKLSTVGLSPQCCPERTCICVGTLHHKFDYFLAEEGAMSTIESAPLLKSPLSNYSKLPWVSLAAIGFFIFWLVSDIRRKPKRCPSGKKWDHAPFFPTCQATCGKGEISDGRGQCASSEIPLTRLHLEDLQAGSLKDGFLKLFRKDSPKRSFADLVAERGGRRK